MALAPRISRQKTNPKVGISWKEGGPSIMVAIKLVEEMTKEAKEQLNIKIKHPFFTAHIDNVEISEAELNMLIVLLQKMRLDSHEIVYYATTITLIQLALDTHEKVTDYKGITRVNKQLTVLAGDYFSGWYYYLLADNHDIKLIGALAEGIKKINENKIKLYNNNHKSFEEVMDLVEQIEMGLINSTRNYFDKGIDLMVMSKMFLLNRLKDEQKLLNLTGASQMLEWVKEMKYEQILQKLDTYLEKLRGQIQEQIRCENLEFIYQTYI